MTSTQQAPHVGNASAPSSTGPHALSEAQCHAFLRDGFVILPRVFSDLEIKTLRETARADKGMHEAHLPVKDARGRTSKLTLWNDQTDDIYGRFACSTRIIQPVEQMLGDEVYHYHSKLSLKEPRVGGAWEWHQDYGYWYGYGCLAPNMLSAMTALDRCDQANGCLQVLRSSHLLGRIDHGVTGTQTGADLERVAVAMTHLELVHVELEPGDTVLFHCNLLHASAPNDSDRPRWTMITAFNAKHNSPYKASKHPAYSTMRRYHDHELLEATSTDPSRRFMASTPS